MMLCLTFEFFIKRRFPTLNKSTRLSHTGITSSTITSAAGSIIYSEIVLQPLCIIFRFLKENKSIFEQCKLRASGWAFTLTVFDLHLSAGVARRRTVNFHVALEARAGHSSVYVYER